MRGVDVQEVNRQHDAHQKCESDIKKHADNHYITRNFTVIVIFKNK